MKSRISSPIQSIQPHLVQQAQWQHQAAPHCQNHYKKKQVKPNVVGNLLNPDDYLICPLASKFVNESCHFKGYLRDNNILFSELYVKIESHGKSILQPLRDHIFLLKKVILYMLCYFFDTVYMIEKVSI